MVGGFIVRRTVCCGMDGIPVGVAYVSGCGVFNPEVAFGA